MLGKGFGKLIYRGVSDPEATFLGGIYLITEFRSNQILPVISVTLTI